MRVCMLLHKSVEFDSRVRREARTLVEAGHDVVVLELAPVPEDRPTLDGFRRRSVVPPAWVKRALPFHLYRVLFLLSFLTAVVRERPEVIHAHDAAMLLPGSIGRRLTGARLVYDSHELATSVPYRERAWAWFVGAIERLVVPRCAAVITVSDGIADRLQRRYGLRARPVVLRNVSDLRRAGGAGGLRSGLGLGDAGLVLHQGAPAPARGCETLIRAMREVPDAHLVFLGTSAMPGYGATLAELADATGAAARVHFVPGVGLEQLLDHTTEADVGVTLLEPTCDNHRLALPNKLFEYLAAGVPVVASDLPEMAALVHRHEVGWTADPEDPGAVAAALREALGRRGDLELRARVARAHEDLRWGRERDRLTGLYAALAGA